MASNYLKLKKYEPCIRTCKELLAKYPNYSDVEKDILSNAMLNLRI